tara:strand:- start:142 stop:306 length:165 start_codon:yes stop_codon:yes gene_type:complete
MPLSAHRKHKVYIAAIMQYGLVSEDSEELSFYNKIKDNMEKDRKEGKMGIKRVD